MLTTDKYIDKLLKIGFQKDQAKQVVEKMLPLAYLVVDHYSNRRNSYEAKNRNESGMKAV